MGSSVRIALVALVGIGCTFQVAPLEPDAAMPDFATSDMIDMAVDLTARCHTNADCGDAGKICDVPSGQCIAECSAMHSCGDAGVCDEDGGVCRQCLHDSDCHGGTPRCDTGVHKCVECLPQMDNCGIGRFCQFGSGSYHCVVGCQVSSECSFLDGGVDGGPDGGSSLQCCGQVCKNVVSDDSNCGQCGTHCAGHCCHFVCVDNNADPSNCGGCGMACSPSHITAACAAGGCSGLCESGYQDCNTDKRTDGCETHTAVDSANCGSCNNSCSGKHLATNNCVGSACTGACVAPFLDCNSDKTTDGCETDSSGDTSNCGSCNNSCSGKHLAATTCAGSACTGACVAPFLDCNSDKTTDGCEIDSSSDSSNCGSCSNSCSGKHLAATTCAGSACTGACVAPFLDCNSDKTLDGCEIDGSSDASNCGSCSNSCAGKHLAATTCAGGACTGACVAPFLDCNMDKTTDGCEKNTSNDPMNCGACGMACMSGKCVNSQCVNVVFVSSVALPIAGLSVAVVNAECQTLATAAGLPRPSSYKAWFSDNMGNSPSIRFVQSASPYALLDGTVVANNWADLIDGTLAAPIAIDQNATPLVGVTVFTGTKADGTAGNTCIGWTSVMIGDTYDDGSNSFADSKWTQNAAVTCDVMAARRVYCFEQ